MRVLVACLVSFALAFIVGGFALSVTVPPEKPKPMMREAADVPSLEMAPALPSLGATRIQAPAAIQPEQRLKAGAPARTMASAPSARPAGRRRATTALRPAPLVARRVPGVLPEAGRQRVSPTAIATVAPEPRVSRPAVVSTTLPPGPRDTNPPQTPNPDVTPAGRSSGAAEGYVLGAGDQIEVNVPHLAAIVTLGPDGMITLPLISPVRAVGKTTAQLASELTGAYAKVLDGPSVTVFVRQYRLSR